MENNFTKILNDERFWIVVLCVAAVLIFTMKTKVTKVEDVEEARKLAPIDINFDVLNRPSMFDNDVQFQPITIPDAKSTTDENLRAELQLGRENPFLSQKAMTLLMAPPAPTTTAARRRR